METRTDEITITEALAELREMFPGKNTLRIGTHIQVGFKSFGGVTLENAMNEARAWAKSRAASESKQEKRG